MILFWLGFFALIALLLTLDLGVLHRKQVAPTMASALGWTIVWVAIGLAFSGVVYLMYRNHWAGAQLSSGATSHDDGVDAAITYVSAYLLEQALSIDNIFVMALLFASFRVPAKYQHRVLFWGILGAIVFRITMLSGGAYLATRFDWVFYIFGAYLAYQGVKLAREGDGDDEGHERTPLVRFLRRYIPVVDGDHDGKFIVRVNGHKALTTVAVCLVVIELTDILFALDSIPAVLSVSNETFIMVTSNIFAILGLRSLYFVLAGAMAKFRYLKLALAVLLVLIGAKMILHKIYPIGDIPALIAIAAILTTGVVASIISTKRSAHEPPKPEPSASNSLH